MFTLLWLLAGCPQAPTQGTEPLGAEDYCEATVEVFCPYYLRCGWTSTDEMATCRQTFLETCNAVYEPRWQALADEGLLAVDEAGLQACAAHLDALSCGVQQHELQGPCADIWDGQVAQGGGCGIGLENFVCDDSTVCVLDLSFCGTCQPKVDDGAACSSEARCGRESACVDEVCVPRSRLGESCDEATPCYVGADCVGGVCTDDAWVLVGQSCGAGVNCPYSSSCLDGTCVVDALLGEECALRACASGHCVEGVCEGFAEPGTSCLDGGECLSGICGDDGLCGELASTCVLSDD